MDEEQSLNKARQMVFRLLTYRARSKKEVRDYLDKKGFGDRIIKETIRDMEYYGYVGDDRFARDFVTYRKERGYGLIRIRYELQLKGIENDIIDRWLDEYFDSDEDLERIKEILDRRASGKNDSAAGDERWMKREAAFLKRRGFQDHLILTALKNYNITK